MNDIRKHKRSTAQFHARRNNDGPAQHAAQTEPTVEQTSHKKTRNKIPFTKVKSLLVNLARFILRALKTIYHALPWHIIILAIAGIAIVAYLSLNIYFASSSRIQEQLNTALTSMTTLEDKTSAIDAQINLASNLDLEIMVTQFDQYEQLLNETDLSLPSKFLTLFAFGSSDERKKTSIDSIYDAQDSFNISKSRVTAEVIHDVAENIKQISDLDISTQKDEFLQATKNLKDSTETGNEIFADFNQLNRIAAQLNESALQYRDSENLQRFNSQYSNLFSELPRELATIWFASLSGTQQDKLSEMRSSTEGLLSAIKV